MCKKITKLVPSLREKDYCAKNPAEVCQLKFNKSPSSPRLQPIVQKYCVPQSALVRTISEEVTTTVANSNGEETTTVEGFTETTTDSNIEETTTQIATTQIAVEIEEIEEVTEEKKEVSKKQSKRLDLGSDNIPSINQNVLNNYDNYKNQILNSYKNQTEKQTGLLKPIKPSLFKQSTTTEATTTAPEGKKKHYIWCRPMFCILDSQETTKIDGFTMQKLLQPHCIQNLLSLSRKSLLQKNQQLSLLRLTRNNN